MTDVNKDGISEVTLKIPHEKKEIDAVLTTPLSTPVPAFTMILTHGAGGDMHYKQLTDLAKALALAGFGVLRFTCKGLNIVYRTKVYFSVVRHMAQLHPAQKGLFLAGRSMGSRAAIGTSIMAQDTPALSPLIKGVICLAYPLHPPKQTTNLRDVPLTQTQHPCLFISGTKDEMAEEKLLIKVVKQMPLEAEAKIKWIESANHGHKVKGRSDVEVTDEICEQVIKWCKELIDRENLVEDEHNADQSRSQGY